jgi:quercetin dioxygenase-like cupin family protein
MNALAQKRRSFLRNLVSLGISPALFETFAAAQVSARQGYVLDSDAGEHLVHFRDGGNIYIKVGATTGSENVAVGTQQVKAGSGIPIHRHFQMDEAFFVLEGSGSFSLNDVKHSFKNGGTIFIPRNSWHGFENPVHELLLLWIVALAGLDGFFRETCNPPGIPPKQFTREQIKEIAMKYQTEFR